MKTLIVAWLNTHFSSIERIGYALIGLYAVFITAYVFKREVNFIHDEHMYWMCRRWLDVETRQLDKAERARNYYRRLYLELKDAKGVGNVTDVKCIDTPEDYEDEVLASTTSGIPNAVVNE